MSNSSSSSTNPRDTVNKAKPSDSTVASQMQKLTQDMEETRQSLKAIEWAIASMTKATNTSSQEAKRERLSRSDARTLEGKEQDSAQGNSNQDESYVPSRSTELTIDTSLQPSLAFTQYNFRSKNMIPRTHSNQRKASQQIQEATLTAAGPQKTETQFHDDGVYKEIEVLRQHLAKIEAGRQRYVEPAHTASVEKAFIDDIIREPVPSNFKTPQLAEYDGTQDPVEHVQGYRMAMMVYGASNALLCKQFPATFRKAAQAWFATLPEKSIQTFDQFVNMFINHFTASRVPRKTNHHLLTIKQKIGESLRAYIARFHSEAVQVERLDQSVAMHALMDGLKDSSFYISLNKREPTSLNDLLRRAEGYIRAEERVAVKEAQETANSERKRKIEKDIDNESPKDRKQSRYNYLHI
ncbi:hypothetical protein SLE2022_401500 [Rubroshorea leprosula]